MNTNVASTTKEDSPQPTLFDLVGVLTKEEAEELKRIIKNNRKRRAKTRKARYEMLFGYREKKKSAVSRA